MHMKEQYAVFDGWRGFEERHGPPIRVGNGFVFATGAYADRTGEVRVEPEQMPRRQRLLNKKAYLEVRLQRTEQDFHSLQASLAGRSVWSYPPSVYGPA